MKKQIWLLLITLAVALLSAQVAFTQTTPVTVKLIAFNDFHGNLETANLSFALPNGDRVPAGGVAYLATHIARLKKTNPNSLVIAAGDNIGATPLLSALFRDEPAIEALNLLGVQVSAVGNHEFDQGAKELLRLQKGVAKFAYLAANVVDRATNRPILPPYVVRSVGGVKIGLIGLTLEGTPRLVSPSGVAGLVFKDEAETINRFASELDRQGVKAIVVLLHEGGTAQGGKDACANLTGAVPEIVKNLSPTVDLVLTGHTHQAYNCVVDRKVVTSASAFGRLLTDIDMQINRRSGEVQSMRARNLIVSRDVAPDPALTALIDKYKAIADPLANRAIGQITADILRQANPTGEMPLGNLIADAQLLATQAPDKGGALVAFMNPGGIRTDLTYAQSPVTYGQAFAVQPFGNNLITMTLTGAQIKQLLEQQFDNPINGQNRILQVSSGFKYRWNPQAPVGDRVRDISINGQPILPNQTYRITVNSFLADGGDNFRVLQEGKNRLGGVTDIMALENYFKVRSPVAPPALDRIQN